MRFFKHFLIAFFAFFSMSCGAHTINKQLKLNKMINIDSMVQIISKYEIEHCPEGQEVCRSFKMSSVSTGSVVKFSTSGSYVLTTGHSCSPKFGIPFGLKNIYIKQTTYIVDSNKKIHKSITVDFDEGLDMCVLHTTSLRAPKIKISNKGPEQGDKVYNYAASYGVFGKKTIPILEGRFSGYLWGYALYTIPAIGGSSGSPIFDAHGKLVGMIHSVHRGFHHLSFSPNFKDMLKFIKFNTPHNAPRGIRTEWTDIPGRKKGKVYLDDEEILRYIKKIQKLPCKGNNCFKKAPRRIK